MEHRTADTYIICTHKNYPLPIPAYVINLKVRLDRKEYILKEFSSRNEFNPVIVEAHTHNAGAVGLWNSIKFIIKTYAKKTDDYILICEDDHCFTLEYNIKDLLNCIDEAKKYGADIMSGGVSWFDDAVQISDNLFWTKKFSGTQFLNIFKQFYDSILVADTPP